MREKTGQKLNKKEARTVMAVVNIACVVFLIVALFFGIRILLNRLFINSYNKEEYNVSTVEKLQKFNFYESYLPHYNLGNAHYKRGEYDKAIGDYKHALEENPPEMKECPVRINLALALIAKIDFDHLQTEKQILGAIRQLQSARQVLIEDGCAHDQDDGGHSPEAEQLKKDIDEKIKELMRMLQQQQSGGGDDDQDNQNDPDQNGDPQNPNGGSSREDDLRDKLDKQKRDSMRERTDANDEKDKENAGGGQNEKGRNW